MRLLRLLSPGVLAAAALALAVDAGAQSTPPPAAAPAAKSTPSVPATGHHRHGTGTPGASAGMKAECQALMARKQETQAKLEAMDAAMDKLVAEMNAAKASRDVDALEKPMAAVVNELVVQRKALWGLVTEMQPAMMDHAMHHMHGTKGAMDCPMMKKAAPADPKAGEKKPAA